MFPFSHHHHHQAFAFRFPAWKSLLLALAVLCMTGCLQRAEDDVSSEVAKSPKRSANRFRVDLNVYAPGMIPGGIGEPNVVATELAEEWMAEHPGKKIVYQPLINTGTSEGEWLKTQLLGGIAPHIIGQNAEIAWPDVDKGWFVPLDEYLDRPNPYVPGNEHWIDTFTNQALMGAKRAPDGKLYCISLDIVETGVFYNKTLLAEIGIDSVPDDWTWSDMYRIMGQIRETGITPMVASGNLASDWGMDIVFELLYHDILADMDMIPSRPDAEGYLGHYLDAPEAGFLFTKGFFTRRDPRWVEMNRILKEWRAYWGKELKNGDPDRMFLTGRAAFYWSGSWFIRRMVVDEYVDFEWGITYIPTITRQESSYGPGTPATVIGGAAMQYHVTNSALLDGNIDDVIDYLMYISAPQSIERLASEALMFIPNVNGAKMSEGLAPFREIFQRRYCAIKWLESMDGKYKKYWRRMLDYYLNDGYEDPEEFLVQIEENFAAWVKSHRNKEDDAAWSAEKFETMEATWKSREERLLRELDTTP